MNLRQQKILEMIVKEYVDTAQPVSSGILVEKYKFNISPATIRAEMNKLEKEGCLYQPHTSAGRAPTDKGYRFFINTLMKRKALTLKEQKTFQYSLSTIPRIDLLMPRIAFLLAEMSSNLAIAGCLDYDESEFFKAGEGKLLKEPEFEDVDYFHQMTEVLDYLDRNIGELFDIIQDETVGIFIGRENPIRQMRSLSMIVSGRKLKSGGKRLIAILGPRRMRYDRNIALIEYIRNLLENF